MVTLDRNMSSEGFSGNVADFAAISDVFDKINPDIVVNATAYTAVDKAESDQQQAQLINAQAVKHLASECKSIMHS